MHTKVNLYGLTPMTRKLARHYNICKHALSNVSPTSWAAKLENTLMKKKKSVTVTYSSNNAENTDDDDNINYVFISEEMKERRKVRRAKSSRYNRYVMEVKNINESGRSKKRLYELTYKEEKGKYDFRHNFIFPYRTALSRIQRGSYDAKGNTFPMIEIENTFIELLLVMAKLK